GSYLSLSARVTADDLLPLTDRTGLADRVVAALALPAGHAMLRFFLRDEVATRFRELSRQVAIEALEAHSHHTTFGDLRMDLISLDLHRRSTIDLNKFYFHDVLTFVDHDLLQLFLTIPPQLKRGRHLVQELYRRHFPELAAIPWAATGHDLYASEEIIARTRQRRQRGQRLRALIAKLTRGHLNITTRERYYDQEIILRENRRVRQVVWPLLRDSAASGLDYFDQRKINWLLGEYDKGKYYYYPAIAKLFTFLAWHRLFILEEHRQRLT
ncbi:MAG: hypothetical protein ABIF77_09585, partial [bacterium]